jgi:protein TonB
VKARYPDEARKLGLEGKVVMILAINEEGKVIDARVVEKAGHGFDEEAVAATKRFIFSPAYVGDKPVAVEIRYTYVFELR